MDKGRDGGGLRYCVRLAAPALPRSNLRFGHSVMRLPDLHGTRGVRSNNFARATEPSNG